MGKIYHFPESKTSADFESSLSELLRSVKKQNMKVEMGDGFFSCDFERFKEIIKKNIYDVLTDDSCFNSSYFHCGLYIADLIAKTAENPPESFYAIDYLSEINNSEEYFGFKKAGDVCFLICSVFTERCNRGCMTYNGYLRIGKSMYANFYNKSKKEIAYLMSDNYEDMAKVTRVAINALSK